MNVNEDEDYDDLAGIFDDEEDEREEYYDVQVTDIEVIMLSKVKFQVYKILHNNNPNKNDLILILLTFSLS